MKKVLLALFALLALTSCSKEANEPKGKERFAPSSMQLEVAAEVPSARALSFSLQNGKPKVSLAGRTTLPVWTFIYDGDNLVYSQLLDWKVEGTKVYYIGDIQISHSYTPTNLTLVAMVVGNKNDGVTKIEANNLYTPSLQDNTIHKLTDLENYDINIPYKMEVKLDYRSDAPTMLYTNRRPAAERKFKPEGLFLRFKIKNELDHDITVTTMRAPFVLPNRRIATSIDKKSKIGWEARTQALIQPRDFVFDEPVHVSAHGTSSDTYFLWIPSTKVKGMFEKQIPSGDGGDDRYSSDHITLLTSNTVQFSKPYHVYSLFTKESSHYQSGYTYDGQFTFHSLRNPLERISETPLNTLGTDFVDASGGYNNTYSSIGYFLNLEVASRFYEPKTYPSKSGEWYVPSVLEWRGIFPGTNGTDNIFETIQIDDVVFENRSIRGLHVKNTPTKGNDYTIYMLRFGRTDAQTTVKEITEERYSSRGGANIDRFSLAQSGLEYARPLLDNSKCYAYRYFIDTDNRWITVENKYIGPNSSVEIRGADDLRDITEGGQIDWSTGVTKRIFPMYGREQVAIPSLPYSTVPLDERPQRICMFAHTRRGLLGIESNDVGLVYLNYIQPNNPLVSVSTGDNSQWQSMSHSERRIFDASKFPVYLIRK
jgi:lipoprotein